VLYLQNLREEIRQTSLIGEKFIGLVNLIYLSFSPQLAQKIEGNEFVRRAVRKLIVKPVVAIIKKSEQVSDIARPLVMHHLILIILLLIDAVLGIILLPVIALVMIFKITFDIWFKRQYSLNKED
jgi:hypothetical protein